MTRVNLRLFFGGCIRRRLALQAGTSAKVGERNVWARASPSGRMALDRVRS